MQQKKGFFHSVARFAEDKGFYIILGLCVVAIGVSGYVLFFTGSEPQGSIEVPEQQAEITVGDQPDEQQTVEPVTVPDDGETPNTETAGTETGTGVVPVDEQPLVQEPEPTISVARPIKAETPTYSRPVSGKLQRAYSVKDLVYDSTMCDWRTHSGADYECAAGDPVYAIADGSVIAVFTDPMKGDCVTLSHDGGLTSTYCGLQTNTTMRTGMTVKAGEPVGTAGGGILIESAQECHVHLEVLKDKEPIDPESLFD